MADKKPPLIDTLIKQLEKDIEERYIILPQRTSSWYSKEDAVEDALILNNRIASNLVAIYRSELTDSDRDKVRAFVSEIMMQSKLAKALDDPNSGELLIIFSALRNI